MSISGNHNTSNSQHKHVDNGLNHQPILLCDDEVADRKQLAETIFACHGLTTYEVDTPEKAQDIFCSQPWSMTIIHSARSPRSALLLCQWIRSRSTIPILMLTKRTEEVDEQMALASGADDYIVKPLDGRIVLARINQQLNRGQLLSILSTEQLLVHGALKLDLVTHVVDVEGREVSLTKTEFSLLEEFLRHQNSLVSREQLLRVLNLTEDTSSSHVIDTHLSRLRTKLSQAGLSGLVVTVHGVGFRLAPL